MSFTLSVEDKTSCGKTLTCNVMKFPAEIITVKALIEIRVLQEINNSGQQHSWHSSGLVNSKNAQLSITEQQNIAIQAFRNQSFFLLVNNKQLTDPEEAIHITKNSKVVFLRLVPLMSG